MEPHGPCQLQPASAEYSCSTYISGHSSSGGVDRPSPGSLSFPLIQQLEMGEHDTLVTWFLHCPSGTWQQSKKHSSDHRLLTQYLNMNCEQAGFVLYLLPLAATRNSAVLEAFLACSKPARKPQKMNVTQQIGSDVTGLRVLPGDAPRIDLLNISHDVVVLDFQNYFFVLCFFASLTPWAALL